jgi:hypothetical protein
MSFAVVHMQKFKSSGVKGIQFHNQRQRESKTNPDIDKSRTKLNYDLHNDKPIDYNKQVKSIIKENVVTNRAIRKDAVVMCNFVVTSDKEFFDKLTDPQQRKFFEKSYEFFKDRYGKENVVAAPVHLDERTPHMHLSIVPVTEDNKLSAKRLLDRKELRAIQSDFPKHMKEQGFELQRGIDAEGKNKHIDTQKFKAIELEDNIKTLEQQQNILKNELGAIKSDFKKVKGIKARFDEINAIEGKYSLVGNKKITIKTSDFEELKNIAKKQHLLENKIDNFERDNKNMRDDLKRLLDSNKKNRDKSVKLEQGFEKYKKEYAYVVDYLKDTEQLDKATYYVKEKRELETQKLKEMNKSFDLER